MHDIYRRAKEEAGYNATYFLQMLADAGPVATARRLVTSTQPSQGFTALWERRRLDLTVEAHVLQERFAGLFYRRRARRRPRSPGRVRLPAAHRVGGGRKGTMATESHRKCDSAEASWSEL